MRSLREPGYRDAIGERFGFFRSRFAGELIWVHAVSAGETVAAAPLIKRLGAAGYPCLVTNMTPAGRDRVKALLGDEVEQCYAPYDLPGAVARFLARNRPRILMTIDTELWPNTFACCKRHGVGIMVVNGRLSQRSARRYGRVPGLVRPMLGAVDRLAVQTAGHRQRFIALGADAGRTEVTGSIKFDGQYAAGHRRRLAFAKKLVRDRPVLLGASTHDGEESALLSLLPVLEGILPDPLLVLAPRHTRRCDRLAGVCAAGGYPAVCFSQLADAAGESGLAAGARVLMLDVMGELESFFPVARLAFIGGSLVPVGGHNLLEAVRAGVPVIMGPHLDNIDDIARQFIDGRAMCVARNREELRDAVTGLMCDESKAARLARAADEVMAANRGALDRVEALFFDMMGEYAGSPRNHK